MVGGGRWYRRRQPCCIQEQHRSNLSQRAPRQSSSTHPAHEAQHSSWIDRSSRCECTDCGLRWDEWSGKEEERTNRLLRRVEVADESGHIKATNIPDHGTSMAIKRGLLLLIKFIVHQEMRLLCIEPALVRVLGADVAISGREVTRRGKWKYRAMSLMASL